MKFTAVIGLVLGGVLLFAAPAMGWTYDDCVEVDFNHPDCEQYPPPETPPEEETPPPVEEKPPVSPPAPPPITIPPPPAQPPAPPAPPELPPKTPEQPPEKPAAPKIEKGEQGKVERRDTPAPVPQVQTVSTSSESGKLPFTGIPAGLLALAGAGLAASGAALRRRVR